MQRLATLALATLTLVAAIGLLGRERRQPLTAPAPAPRTAEQDEQRFTGAHSVCSGSSVAPLHTANVNLIADDGFDYGGGCATPQDEPTLAVDPTDPANVVAGANDFRVCCDFGGDQDSTAWAYWSRDGGATWTNVVVPGLTRQTGARGVFRHFDVAEDPAVAFAPDGTLYYASIVFATDTSASGIAVTTSHDGGRSWERPQLLWFTNTPTIFNDKEWVAVGAHGEVVVTWTQFHSDSLVASSEVVGAISRDGGATWNDPVTLSDHHHQSSWGATPLWAADGTLYTVFETAKALTRARDSITVSIYRPGRRLVERDVARAYDDLNCFAVNAHLRPTLTGEAFRVSSIPSASLDPVSQTVAIAWVDGERGCRPGRPPDATDVQVKLVFVHGTHASKARIVTSGGDKALPAVAYRDGKVVVGYYTRSFAPADCTHAGRRVCLDYAYSTSTDGFGVEHRLSDGSSNPFEQFEGSFMGDYTSVAIGQDGVAHAAWTDTRGGDQNIFGATFTP